MRHFIALLASGVALAAIGAAPAHADDDFRSLRQLGQIAVDYDHLERFAQRGLDDDDDDGRRRWGNARFSRDDDDDDDDGGRGRRGGRDDDDDDDD